MGYVDETSQRVEEQDGAGIAAVIETLQSIIIAFAIAFVFKHFVAEAYVIPTGSMAPTLYGAHLIARGPDSGFEYAVGPKDVDPTTNIATGEQRDVNLIDPMIGAAGDNIYFSRAKTRMGDRIFVQRYLYSLVEPRRFDVVVFKYPVDPRQNFIKRLIGIGNETIWLADGDVFAEPNGSTGFSIQRKPAHVQRAVWQTVYSSDYIPIIKQGSNPTNVQRNWRPPWDSAEFDLTKRYYQSENPSSSRLTWNNRRIEISDRTVYNDGPRSRKTARPPAPFGVSDLRLAAGVIAESEGLSSTIHLETRGHEFEAIFGNGGVTLQMRRKPASGVAPNADPWTTLATANHAAAKFIPGEAANIEFWHVDQALKLWIDGDLVAEATYDWDARTRLIEATGLDPQTLLNNQYRGNQYEDPRIRAKAPEVNWAFRDSKVTLHHVELDRDLFYQPESYNRSSRAGSPALGTHPNRTVKLNGDQFFMCGDNSAASSDGRVWQEPTAWVKQEFDGVQGIVPRELVLGKAFFVYYPSPEGLKPNATRFVPNFGRMRLIR